MSEEKKYAGKFDSVEALEEGYKNAAKVYDANVELSKRIEDIERVPEDYVLPEGVESNEDIQHLKTISRTAKLNQEKFSQMAKEIHQKVKSSKDQFEVERKSIGDEKYNVLKGYVENHYPTELQGVVMDKLVRDKSARESAFKHRDNLLSSATPGIGTVTGQTVITHEEVMKAAKEHFSNKNDPLLRDKYIKMTHEYANRR